MRIHSKDWIRNNGEQPRAKFLCYYCKKNKADDPGELCLDCDHILGELNRDVGYYEEEE